MTRHVRTFVIVPCALLIAAPVAATFAALQKIRRMELGPRKPRGLAVEWTFVPGEKYPRPTRRTK